MAFLIAEAPIRRACRYPRSFDSLLYVRRLRAASPTRFAIIRIQNLRFSTSGWPPISVGIARHTGRSPKASRQFCADLGHCLVSARDSSYPIDDEAALLTREYGLNLGQNDPSIQARIALAQLEEALSDRYSFTVPSLDGTSTRPEDLRARWCCLTSGRHGAASAAPRSPSSRRSTAI